MSISLFSGSVEQSFPPTGVWENRYFRHKWQLSGELEVLADRPASAASAASGVSVSGSIPSIAVQPGEDPVALRGNFGATLRDRIHGESVSGSASAGFVLSAERLQSLGNSLGEDLSKFGARFFLQVMNVQTKLELPDRGAGLAFGASFDPHFCFFSTTLSLEHTVLEALRDRLQFKVSGSLSVKFGPSAAVWADLAARAGGGMVSQFLARICNASVSAAAPASGAIATGALAEALMFINVAAIAVPLAITSRDIIVEICRAARRSGYRRGRMLSFCCDYVQEVFGRNSGNSAARDRAQSDIARAGGVSRLQLHLLRSFGGGLHYKEKNGQVVFTEIQALGERLWLHLEQNNLI